MDAREEKNAPIDYPREMLANNRCPYTAELRKAFACIKYRTVVQGLSHLGIARGKNPCTRSDFQHCPLIQGKQILMDD